MPIQVKCQNCQAQFVAKEEFAGRRGKCPKCQAAIVVPQGYGPPGSRRTQHHRGLKTTAEVGAIADAALPTAEVLCLVEPNSTS